MIFNLLAVVGVSQLVRQRHHAAKAARKVREHAALFDKRQVRAKRAAHFPAARVKIDPGVLKGGVDHVGQIGRKIFEVIHQVGVRFFGGKFFGAGFAHADFDVVPGQAVFVAQQLGFVAQVGMEFGQVFANGAPHGVQRGLLHAGLIQRHGQRVFVAAHFGFHVDLGFNAVEREGNGRFNFVVGFKLGLVGGLALGGIVAAGQAADGGQRQLLVAKIGYHGRGQVVEQVVPGAAAGNIHFGENLFALVTDFMRNRFHNFVEIEMVIF